MKELFRGYYKPSQSEFQKLWEESLFVFDTNTLLNLYRYPKETREVMLNILDSIKEKIWIPYQVAYEYHKNLLETIFDQNAEYNNMKTKIQSSIAGLKNDFKTLRHSNINLNAIIEKLDQTLAVAEEELDTQKSEHPDLEALMYRINQLLENRVGPSYDQDKLNAIYTEGEQRYEKKIPPGFMDKKKKDATSYYDGITYIDKYGDLVYWIQTLDKAKEESTASIILITDDNKEDWVQKVRGEKKGIHIELINEFKRETNSKNIYFYNSEQFVASAQEYLKLGEQENYKKVIQEIINTKEVIKENVIDLNFDNTENKEFKNYPSAFLARIKFLSDYSENQVKNIILNNFKDEFFDVHRIYNKENQIYDVIFVGGIMDRIDAFIRLNIMLNRYLENYIQEIIKINLFDLKNLSDWKVNKANSIFNSDIENSYYRNVNIELGSKVHHKNIGEGKVVHFDDKQTYIYVDFGENRGIEKFYAPFAELSMFNVE